ncbi:hypothetical protein ABIF63_008943 [Bradyrhizobium japonicum]|uniref:AbiEi antitoxin N-terminal domain-containing protein n=1 Tax=Bradyrhizobium japonicum TaxID=375 RepID=A0ABV2S6N5_BRAJP
MAKSISTQQDRAIELLKARGIARPSELATAGVTAATIARMKEKGLVVQRGRGLYQLPDAPIDTHHSLAEAAKRVPKGVVALTSALAFHELTDTIIFDGLARHRSQRPPAPSNQSAHAVRSLQLGTPSGGCRDAYDRRLRGEDLQPRQDRRRCFSLPTQRRDLALEGMREALRTRKAKPSEIADFARKAGVWKAMQPYMDAMIANG